jgi:hypothetical protein
MDRGASNGKMGWKPKPGIHSATLDRTVAH